MDKIIVATKEAANSGWMKHLPVPLTAGEKVIVSSDQKNVAKGYVRVRHGKGEAKVESIFALSHFRRINGKALAA